MATRPGPCGGGGAGERREGESRSAGVRPPVDSGILDGVDERLSALRVADVDRASLRFLATVHALTGVHRLNRVLDGSRSETSAEHSWHLALSAVMLREHAGPTVTLPRVVEMLLIHDIVEVDTGDVPIYDEPGRVAIAEDEERAAARLFSLLLEPDASFYLNLWREFETGESDDARFARALDRLQPILVHWAGGGIVWRERGVTVGDERKLLATIEESWPPLAPLAAAIIQNALESGMLASSP
jgi:putative hydrolase of HD superfamily